MYVYNGKHIFYFALISIFHQSCNEEILTLYAQFLSHSFKSIHSIRNYIARVNTLHNILDLDFPQALFHLKLGLRGKTLAHCPKRMKPMGQEILNKIALVWDFSCKEHVCLWCLFLFAFFLFARTWNLVPDTSKDFSKCLLRKDVRFFGNNLIVSFYWTKTIQCRDRVLQLPLLRTGTICVLL